MTITIINYLKDHAIYKEMNRYDLPGFDRKTLEILVNSRHMKRLYGGRYDELEAYGKQTAYDEYEEIIVSE